MITRVTTNAPDSPSAPPTTTHPYAVRVPLVLGNEVNLTLKEDEALLQVFGRNGTIRLTPEHTSPWENSNGLKRLTATVEAFDSASAAERGGMKFVGALLWVAVAKNISMVVETRTGIFPFSVRDRNQSTGVTCRSEITRPRRMTLDEIASLASTAYDRAKDLSDSVVTSLEFFASSRMEATERSKFISLVVALEALAVQADYAEALPALPGLLSELATQLTTAPFLAGSEHDAVRTSLSDRMKQLRQESVGQAIRRTIKPHVKDAATVKFVNEAYSTRSKILHEGTSEPELQVMRIRLEGVMREIYASMLGLPLEA